MERRHPREAVRVKGDSAEGGAVSLGPREPSLHRNGLVAVQRARGLAQAVVPALRPAVSGRPEGRKRGCDGGTS